MMVGFKLNYDLIWLSLKVVICTFVSYFLLSLIGLEHSNLHLRISLQVSLSFHPPIELNLSNIVSECGL
jgi:hypothetical protein